MGSRKYIDDPSTRLLCLVAKIEGIWLVWVPPGRSPSWFDPRELEFVPDELRGSQVVVHTGASVPRQLQHAIEDGYTFVAHNATGFDAPAWAKLIGGPQPTWYDTVPCARAAGLPGKLDDIGELFTGAGKDAAGSKVMKMLAKAQYMSRTGGVEYPVGTPAAWNAILRYNVIDVSLLEKVYHETQDYGEADVLQVDAAINDRGVAVDLELAEMLRAAWYFAELEACAEIKQLTHGVIDAKNVRSVQQVQEWIAEQGVNLSSLDKNQVKRLIETPEEFADDADDPRLATVVEVLRLRQVATSAAAGKLASLRGSVRGGRACDMLVYYGAHTGRWTGRGFQPQNMGRGEGAVDVEACLEALDPLRTDGDTIGAPGDDVAAALRSVCPGIPMRDILSSLTRPVFFAPVWQSLLVCDYAAIEARGVAWVAGDDKLLDAFREGRDPYCEMASTVFGRQVTKQDKVDRHVGKTLVLGCGYGMSGNKYRIYARQNGIDLEALGTSAELCVKAYRERHKAIKSLWYAFGDAALDVVEKRCPQRVGKCVLAMRGRHLEISLPSGRPIVYRNARIEQLVPVYCKMLGLPEVPKPTVVYEHPRGYTKGIYGGSICENIVQAICRDLLAVALVRCERDGLNPVLHVHDEIVCEVPSETAGAHLARLIEIMAEPPPWAAGFPIGVEGFASPRYVKSPFWGYSVIKGESV